MRAKRETVLARVDEAYRIALEKHGSRKRFPVGYCYIMCHEMLSNPIILTKGWRVGLVDGTFKGKGHYWLQLSDGTIIDPTLHQFVMVISPRELTILWGTDKLYRHYVPCD